MEPRTVLLVRHGAVDLPAVGTGVPRMYGPNQPLSDHGIQQGLRLGHRLASEDLRPDIIYTSPFRRAYQTAQLLHDTLPQHPVVIPSVHLSGAHTPQWDHRPETELGHMGGNLFADNPFQPEIHGETLPQTYTRVISEYKRLVESHKTGTIAIVTHGEIIGMIMHYLKFGDQGTPGLESTIDKGEAFALYLNSEGKLIETRLILPEGPLIHREKES